MADKTIIEEISQAIDNITFGSVEVIVQNGEVTQISTRIIKKTNPTPKPTKQFSGTIIRKGSGSGINLNFKY
jgi:hypothetical protein